MINSHKEFLLVFGWDAFFESHVADLALSSLIPARVICEERSLYRVQTALNTVLWAAIPGGAHLGTLSRGDFPAVGDWVMLEIPAEADRGIIRQIVARKTLLQRRQVGSTGDMQILATNVDFVFVTTSLNADLNFKRIERYLTVAKEGGATPVILLTKADLWTGDLAAIIEEVQKTFPGVRTHALSQGNFEKVEFLKEYLTTGTTSVFLGSSGVGKSTLVNFLITSDESDDEKIKTQDVNSYNSRGRHTTTSRNLYVSRYGGLVIDTPGMRELQLSAHAEGLKAQFRDVEELIAKCKFSNCQHQSEPRCAIKEALSAGTLAASRWEGYLKLLEEVRVGMIRQAKIVAAQERKTSKKKGKPSHGKGRRF